MSVLCSASVAWSTLLLLILSGASASNITFCIVEEETTDTLEDVSKGKDYLEQVDSLLRSRLVDLQLNISIVRHVVSPWQFPWLALTACEFLNASCAGVVTLASCQHAVHVETWAKDHAIPHVTAPRNTCTMTPSRQEDTPTWEEHELLRDLLLHLGWTQVAMLVDSRGVAGLVKQLSDVYLGSLLFRIIDQEDNDTAARNNSEALVQHVQNHLSTVKESPFFNILVVASYESAANILRQAQTMGLLSRDHFWVITLPYSHCFTLPKEVKVKDANILVVRPLQGGVEEGGEGSKVCYNKASVCEEPSEHADALAVAESVEALVKSAEQTDYLDHAHNDTENSSICENRTDVLDRRRAVIKTLEEMQKAQMLSRSDNSYAICSTESDQPGGLVDVGRWSQSKGLQLTVDQVYRNTFRDFGHRQLRVGTQEAKPFVQRIGNSSNFEGFCVDILDELAQALKFTYVFVEPEDGEWGAPVEDGTGNWTGIIQQVLKKEVDFGIGPFTITSIREEVIDFTKPFMEDGVGILTQRPNSDAKNMFKMFTPLTPLVWGALAGAVVLVSVCLYSIERLSPYSARNLDGNRKLGVMGCVWLIYGSYMEQGGDPHPRSVSARCLVGFWWLFTILMTSTYTANLAAFLTVTIEDSPVNSLSELAHNSELQPLVKRGSNVKTLFQEAEGGIYEEIWHKMAGMPTVKSNSEAQQYVLQGTHAYMTDASQLEYIMLKDCTKYSVAKELFNTGGFGFVLHEDSPYMDVVNYNIMKMQEAGLMDKWRQRWWSSPDPCTSTDRTSAAKELDWPSLSGLFYIFLGVAFVSVVLRLLELGFHSDKLLQVWNHLKSMVRMAASSEGGSTSDCKCSEGHGTLCSYCSTKTGPRRSRQRSSSCRVRSDRNGSIRSGFRSSASDGVGGCDEESVIGHGDISVVCGSALTVNRSVRSPEFQDFDNGIAYWEPSVQRRESVRLSARRGSPEHLE